MPRRLLNLLTALSVLLCAAAVALWVRSYVVEDMAAYTRTQWVVNLQVSRGALVFQHGRVVSGDGFDSNGPLGFRHGLNTPPPPLGLGGAEAAPGPLMPGWRTVDLTFRFYHFFWCPLWLPFLLTFAVPGGRCAVLLRDRRRKARLLNHFCRR